jgi:hypothetical protein
LRGGFFAQAYKGVNAFGRLVYKTENFEPGIFDHIGRKIFDFYIFQTRRENRRLIFTVERELQKKRGRQNYRRLPRVNAAAEKFREKSALDFFRDGFGA